MQKILYINKVRFEHKGFCMGFSVSVLNAICSCVKKSGSFTCSSKADKLFRYSRKHNFTTDKGELNEKGLILTHLTNYPPVDGFICTSRSAIHGPRDSVHFAVNHGVTAHEVGNWNACKYAILIPLNAARTIKKNIFVGGVAGDFYSHGKIRIPKGSVIIRHNPKIKKGCYKISDSSEVAKFKRFSGVKIVETSEANMKETTDNVIQKLGYQIRNTADSSYWGTSSNQEAFEYFKLFNAYLKKNGMITALHTYTPNGKCEVLIGCLQARAKCGLGWSTNSNDRRKEFLNAIDYIEKYAKKTKYPLDFEIDILRNIIENSKTPQAAVKKLQSAMLIKPFKPNMEALQRFNPIGQDLLITRDFRCLVGGKSAKKADKQIQEYLSAPSQEQLNMLNYNVGTAIKEESQIIPDCEAIRYLVNE